MRHLVEGEVWRIRHEHIEPLAASAEREDRPVRNSTFRCNARALSLATAIASAATSVAMTRSNRPSVASASASAPEPVPTSATTPPLRATLQNEVDEQFGFLAWNEDTLVDEQRQVAERSRPRHTRTASPLPDSDAAVGTLHHIRRDAVRMQTGPEPILANDGRHQVARFRACICDTHARPSVDAIASTRSPMTTSGVEATAPLPGHPSSEAVPRYPPFHRLDQPADVAVHDSRQVMEREVDPVIGDALCGKLYVRIFADRSPVDTCDLQLRAIRLQRLRAEHRGSSRAAPPSP